MHWKTFAGVGLSLAAGAVIWRGLRNGRRLELTEETIAIPALPAPFDGFRLLQLSDLHLRRHSRRVDDILALVDRLSPDLVCLTGDLVFTALSMDTVEDFLRRLAARHTVVGIYGNADYRPGITDDDRARWGEIVPMLANSALCLQREDACLWMVGVDDPHHGRDSLATALTLVPPGVAAILLAHSPEVILRPLDPRVRLILSGHTHGGQICLPNGAALYHNTALPAKYASGRHQVGDAVLYVSRGIGSTRFPLRYACLPEATLFTLIPA